MIPAPVALVYNDDDWDYMASADTSDLGLIYDPYMITTVSGREQTTAADYIENHLPAPYEFIFIRSHGWPGGHGFYRQSRTIFDYVFSDNYRSIDPEAVFYSLFVCSGADFTITDNLAGTIAFNPDDSGFLSIGSTKTGGMWYATRFYTVIEDRSIFGEAFRQWFNHAQITYPSYAPRWWYGMVLIGDAALTRNAFLVESCNGDFDSDGDVDDLDLAQFAADFGRKDWSGNCIGDSDGDGDVEGFDLAKFTEDFGRKDCPVGN